MSHVTDRGEERGVDHRRTGPQQHRARGPVPEPGGGGGWTAIVGSVVSGVDAVAPALAGLMDTLRTLLDNHFAVQPTAAALYIHRNTLQKRLANVEQLLEIDLGDLDAVVDLRLGLHAAELVGDSVA